MDYIRLSSCIIAKTSKVANHESLEQTENGTHPSDVNPLSVSLNRMADKMKVSASVDEDCDDERCVLVDEDADISSLVDEDADMSSLVDEDADVSSLVDEADISSFVDEADVRSLLVDIKEEPADHEDQCMDVQVEEEITDICAEFACCICDEMFLDAASLRAHMTSHTKPAEFQCQFCGKQLVSAVNLQYHLKMHEAAKEKSRKIHVCDTCGKTFPTRYQLKAHLLVHDSNKPFACEHCDKCFKTKGNLKIHERTHNGERPFVCAYCGKSFTHSSNLNNHIRDICLKEDHPKRQTFMCERCPKTFNRRSNLKIHMRSHTQERPYSCEICGRGFQQLSLLTRHELVHTGVKDYVCEVCSRPFALKTNMLRHMKKHKNHSKYECDLCQLKFFSQEAFKAHVTEDHPNTWPFTCEDCGSGFRNNSSRTRHIKQGLCVPPGKRPRFRAYGYKINKSRGDDDGSEDLVVDIKSLDSFRIERQISNSISPQECSIEQPVAAEQVRVPDGQNTSQIIIDLSELRKAVSLQNGRKVADVGEEKMKIDVVGGSVDLNDVLVTMPIENVGAGGETDVVLTHEANEGSVEIPVSTVDTTCVASQHSEVSTEHNIARLDEHGGTLKFTDRSGVSRVLRIQDWQTTATIEQPLKTPGMPPHYVISDIAEGDILVYADNQTEIGEDLVISEGSVLEVTADEVLQLSEEGVGELLVANGGTVPVSGGCEVLEQYSVSHLSIPPTQELTLGTSAQRVTSHSAQQVTSHSSQQVTICVPQLSTEAATAYMSHELI